MEKVIIEESILKRLPKKIVTVGYNTESYLLEYGNYLIKCFKNKNSYNISRKKYTIDLLDAKRSDFETYLEECILPLFWVNDYTKFAMKYYDSKSLAELYYTNYQKDLLMHYLIEVGKFLFKLNRVREERKSLKNFYINDLNLGNILVYDGKIKIGDMDGCKIDDNERMPSKYLAVYSNSKLFQLDKKYIVDKDDMTISANEQSELFCYIMMILHVLCERDLSCLSYEDYNQCLDKLQLKGYNKELIDCFRIVYEKEDNINPYQLLKKI